MLEHEFYHKGQARVSRTRGNHNTRTSSEELLSGRLGQPNQILDRYSVNTEQMVGSDA